MRSITQVAFLALIQEVVGTIVRFVAHKCLYTAPWLTVRYFSKFTYDWLMLPCFHEEVGEVNTNHDILFRLSIGAFSFV